MFEISVVSSMTFLGCIPLWKSAQTAFCVGGIRIRINPISEQFLQLSCGVRKIDNFWVQAGALKKALCEQAIVTLVTCRESGFSGTNRKCVWQNAVHTCIISSEEAIADQIRPGIAPSSLS
jgi:hypothetical protein